MACNQNCQQGRNCNCSPPPIWKDPETWIAGLGWTIAMTICALLLWVGVGIAHGKPTTYQQNVRCLAEVVYREARGEEHRGQLAVAQTVINRTKSAIFPNDLCKVVFQPGQFSWTKGWKGDWRADYDSYQVARVALMGTHSLRDFKALYFHNQTVNPGWKYKKIATIGNHSFYT